MDTSESGATFCETLNWRYKSELKKPDFHHRKGITGKLFISKFGLMTFVASASKTVLVERSNHFSYWRAFNMGYNFCKMNAIVFDLILKDI